MAPFSHGALVGNDRLPSIVSDDHLWCDARMMDATGLGTTIGLSHGEAGGDEDPAPDADAEIEPVPTTGRRHKPEPELDRLSNILKTFNEQFGNISWSDSDKTPTSGTRGSSTTRRSRAS